MQLLLLWFVALWRCVVLCFANCVGVGVVEWSWYGKKRLYTDGAWGIDSEEVAIDETVELFPSYARETVDEGGNKIWEVRAEGVIFENEHEDYRSIRYHALKSLESAAHYFGVDGE